jgi:chromosome segregation ATPase
MDYSTTHLGLSEAADLAGCSRDTIRRAAQKGELKAELGPGVRGPQWWILEADLLAWIEDRDAVLSTAEVLRSSARQDDAHHNTAKEIPCLAKHEKSAQLSTAEVLRSSARQDDAEHSTASPPAEVYIALIDRLSHSERRAIELELALRQSQRLLAENAESITEKEALAKEARAKLEELEQLEQTRQSEVEKLTSQLAAAQEAEARLLKEEQAREAETAKLRAELETTRNQLLESQKPKGFLSWLGLRKKRASDTSNDSKAV